MSHDAETELVKKLKCSRDFPGKTLKAIIQGARYATRLIEFFLRSTDYEHFMYTSKQLQKFTFKFADKLCRKVAIPTYFFFLKETLLFIYINCGLHQQRKHQKFSSFNQVSGNKSYIIFQQLDLFRRICFCDLVDYLIVVN